MSTEHKLLWYMEPTNDRPPRPFNLMKALLHLPNELIISVLVELEPKDLLTLRLVNHLFHDLVHKHEVALATRYRDSNGPIHLLNSPSDLEKNNLSTLLELAFRVRFARKLADMMSDRIISHVKFRNNPFDAESLKKWNERKVKRLSATFEVSILILFDFFVGMREALLQAAFQFRDLSADEYLSLGQLFELDQQYMIEKVPAELLVDVSETWRVIQAIAGAKGLSPTRFFRRRQTNAGEPSSYSAGHITMYYLVTHGGLYALGSLLCETAFTGFVQQFSPLLEKLRLRTDKWGFKQPTPRSTIKHIESSTDAQFTEFPPLRDQETQTKFVESQNLWEKSAMAVMQRRRMVNAVDPHIPIIETWLRDVIFENGDPWIDFRRWSRPDSPAPP